MPGRHPLRTFVRGVTELMDSGAAATTMLAEAERLLHALIACEAWLPEGFDQVAPEPGYAQRLLHGDPRERFSVVCFAARPGSRTPVHDHRVWGVVGVLRGVEISTEFVPGASGQPLREGRVDRVAAGEVVALGPDGTGAPYDIHSVRNPGPGTSVSVHLYGANIGAVMRGLYDPATGACTEFASGYDNAFVPNLWVSAGQSRLL